MPTRPAADPELVARAAEVLRAGGSLVLPTDTVYGVAVLASAPGAAARLAALKDRSAGQPIAVLVADGDAGLALAGEVAPEVRRLAARCWPGPLTLVVPRGPGAAALDLGGDGSTVGVRCPDHDLVRALAAAVGPIATTSANRHGAPTPTTAADAAAALVGPVDLVVDGGMVRGTASTVVDCTGTPWRLLREGPVTLSELEEAAAG